GHALPGQPRRGPRDDLLRRRAGRENLEGSSRVLQYPGKVPDGAAGLPEQEQPTLRPGLEQRGSLREPEAVLALGGDPARGGRGDDTRSGLRQRRGKGGDRPKRPRPGPRPDPRAAEIPEYPTSPTGPVIRRVTIR